MPTLERRSLMEPDEILRLRNQFYDVLEVEDFEYTEPEFSRIAGVTPPAPIATLAETAPFELRNLEPDVIKQNMLVDFSGISRPPLRIYQVFMGINVAGVNVMLEVMAGARRLGTARQPVANAANRNIGRFNYRTSPSEYPTAEFWVQTGQVPSVRVFNTNGFATANVLLECIGRKFTMLEMTPESHPDFFQRFEAGQRVAYRRITQFGLDSEYSASSKISNQ